MSQVRLVNQFNRQMCFDWNESWSKNQAYWMGPMAWIWGQFGLYTIFSIFANFGTLCYILVGFTYLVQVEKHMVITLTFLSSFCYMICRKIPPTNMKKGIMSGGKKYVYLCHLAFFSKYFLRGEVSSTSQMNC